MLFYEYSMGNFTATNQVIQSLDLEMICGRQVLLCSEAEHGNLKPLTPRTGGHKVMSSILAGQ